MKTKSLVIVLIFVVCLGAAFASTGCNQNSSSQETEKLKKELEDLKKKSEDEKLDKQKEELAKKEEDLKKEKEKLEGDKKKAEATKNTVQPVKNGVVFAPGQIVIVKISNGYLRMRSRPSETSDVIASAGNDDEVEMVEYDRTWCKVRFLGKEGFMATRFLTQYED